MSGEAAENVERTDLICSSRPIDCFRFSNAMPSEQPIKYYTPGYNSVTGKVSESLVENYF